MYVRVVEVTGKTREPVLLENDDVLRPTDVVCLLDEISDASDEDDEPTNGGLKNIFVSGKGGYVKGSGISRQLQEYNFKISKISFTVSRWILVSKAFSVSISLDLAFKPYCYSLHFST